MLVCECSKRNEIEYMNYSSWNMWQMHIQRFVHRTPFQLHQRPSNDYRYNNCNKNVYLFICERKRVFFPVPSRSCFYVPVDQLHFIRTEFEPNQTSSIVLLLVFFSTFFFLNISFSLLQLFLLVFFLLILCNVVFFFMLFCGRMKSHIGKLCYA